ncbi:MFS transporter [Nanoarchaeota archaeon]
MKKELHILLLSAGLFMLAGGLFGPIYAVFVEDIGGDLLTAGMAYGAFAIAAGVLILFISKWEDRVKHKEKLLVLGYGMSCVGFLGYLFIDKPWHLFLVQIVFGIGEAVSAPAFDALYSKNVQKGKVASQWGAWEGMDYMIGGVSAVIGGGFASLYGFKSLFGIMFILSLAGLLVSFFLVRGREK